MIADIKYNLEGTTPASLDINALKAQGIFLARCLVCKELSPQFDNAEDLADWLVDHGWVLDDLGSGYLTFCKQCWVSD